MDLKTDVYEQHELEFTIADGGHAFCNLLRKTLLEEESVVFTGYNVEHPLLADPVFTLKTERRHTNTVLRESLEMMLARTEEFRKEFVQAVQDYDVS
jgi:DNA-directed RNA polymerase subunit L